MRPVQVMFDERLLAKLDADEDVQKIGRSAVLRRIVSDYLRRKRESAIDARYRKGYADGTGLEPEFDGWEEEGVWPTE
jgi:metal-responsive CopG/Arc/MetJ family transcriptional regulator